MSSIGMYYEFQMLGIIAKTKQKQYTKVLTKSVI